MLNFPVVQPASAELTAWGAAVAAGLAVGVWPHVSALQPSTTTVYQPAIAAPQRRALVHGWHKAVERSYGWVDE